MWSEWLTLRSQKGKLVGLPIVVLGSSVFFGFPTSIDFRAGAN